MIKKIICLISLGVLLTGCASAMKKNCEDVVEVAEQNKQCSVLKKQIIQAKNNPVVKSELERRYQQDCIDSRYYRDDKGSEICKDSR